MGVLVVCERLGQTILALQANFDVGIDRGDR